MRRTNVISQHQGSCFAGEMTVGETTRGRDSQLYYRLNSSSPGIVSRWRTRRLAPGLARHFAPAAARMALGTRSQTSPLRTIAGSRWRVKLLGSLWKHHFILDLVGRLLRQSSPVHQKVLKGIQSCCSFCDPKMRLIEEAKKTWRTADAVCFDVDSTVIMDEGIDELAAFCGRGKEVSAW